MSNDVTNDDDVPLTEITIQPDGRVYVQGLSREVLEVLVTLQPDDPHVAGLLAHVTDLESKVDGNKS
jgi:hypothetical protein